jgi:hypothetical protein
MTEVLFPTLPIIVVFALAVAGAVWVRRGRPRGGVPTDRRWRDGGAGHGWGDSGGGDGGGGDGGGGD